ncbi:MAG: hypothetical protein RL885_30005, partial [Planctomycetota bacterium]
MSTSTPVRWIRCLVIFLCTSIWVTSAFAQEPEPVEEETVEEEVLQEELAEEEILESEEVASDEAPPVAPGLRFHAPAGALMTLVVNDTDAIQEAFSGTALAELLEDEEVAAFVEEIQQGYERKAQEIADLDERIADLEIDSASDLMTELSESFTGLIDEESFGLRSATFSLYVPGKIDDDFDAVAMILTLGLKGVEAEGLKKLLEDACEKGLGESWSKDESIEGPEDFALRAFTSQAGGDEPKHLWYFLDGTDVYVGLNAADLLPSLREEPDPKVHQAMVQATEGLSLGAMHLDLEQVIEKALAEQDEDDRDDIRRQLGLLGVKNLDGIVVNYEIVGRSLRESFSVKTDGAPSGLFRLFGSLDAGRSLTLKALTLPAPRVLEMEGRWDTEYLASWIPQLLDEWDPEDESVSGAKFEESVQEALGVSWKELLAAFDGTWAFCLSSPPLGLSVPRLAMSFGIGDREGLDALLKLAKEKGEGLIFEDAELEGSTYTTVKVPNSPVPLVPTFAIHEGQLVVTEMPNTFKAMLRARGDDAGLSLPETESTSMRMAYDVEEMYRLFFDRYFPLIRVGLSAMGPEMQDSSLADIDMMPGSSTIAPYLGRGSGQVIVDQNGLRIQAESSLGSPLSAMAGSVYAPLGAWFGGMGLEEARATKERIIARHQLEQVAGAIQTYQASFGGGESLPGSLGQLVERGLVEDVEIFLVPSDEEPLSIEYENLDGEIETFASSYKYMPQSKLQVPEDRLYDWEGSDLELRLRHVLVRAREGLDLTIEILVLDR